MKLDKKTKKLILERTEKERTEKIKSIIKRDFIRFEETFKALS